MWVLLTTHDFYGHMLILVTDNQMPGFYEGLGINQVVIPWYCLQIRISVPHKRTGN